MTTQHTISTGSRGRRAFTLIELIVAIGAVAIVSVGIAAIFASIGKTVAGGRRVSVLNQYAALIERQMRADFEGMTREGALVIRQQFADVDQDGRISDPADRVAVYPDEPAGHQRLRRIDELLFFTRGEFSSARTPVVPGLTASSSEAMVYYGHGERLDPISDRVGKSINGGNLRYDRPQTNDGSVGRPYRPELALGAKKVDPTNPNRYAASWSLLRQVTVLAPPSGGNQTLPSEGDPQFWSELGLDPVEALDSAVQVGGQPAATSPFRTLAGDPRAQFLSWRVHPARGRGERKAPDAGLWPRRRRGGRLGGYPPHHHGRQGVPVERDGPEPVLPAVRRPVPGDLQG
ncbi:MAG: type II secretion system protein [Phycisphaerales bacterium]|nr:type II secretion system protein [Phycisphaerales bacterium]